MTEQQVSDYAAEKIREARKQRGWNADDLARRCGLSGNVVENIESGRRDRDGHRRRDISTDELVAISRALNISPLKLLPAITWLDPAAEEIRAVEEEMAADRERLAHLDQEMHFIQGSRHVIVEKIVKNEWLIEQLRQAVEPASDGQRT